MNEVDELKVLASKLPHSPGVYLFKDGDGKVIYVGKAKDLQKRVGQYFSGHDNRPQLPFLMTEAKGLDYTVVGSELESLFLESTLIKQYLPAFNIRLKDDKNYAFIKVDSSTEIPTIGYARTVNDSSSKFFGPYSSTLKIKQTLDTVRKIFRYCSNDKISKRPCFYYFLHRCPGVCIGLISLEEYREHIERIVLFLSGKTGQVKKELGVLMKTYSKNREFEKAAKIRDQLKSLDILGMKQIVSFPNNGSWDFISTASDGFMTCVNLFKVRGGKLLDKDAFIFENPLGGSQIILQSFLEKYYNDTSDIPKSIFTETEPENKNLIIALIKNKFNRAVEIIKPVKGEKLKLILLGATNAKEFLEKWQRSSADNRDKLNSALLTLQTILQLPTLPNRIECYDMSNTQGTNPVGSMVVFEKGLPAKSEYRKFKVKVKDTPDDFAMMKEVLTRRLSRITNDKFLISNEEGGDIKQAERIEDKDKNEGRDKWKRPDLIVVDGGKGQLSVAVEVRDSLGLTVPMVGLAKRIEEIFLPHESTPIILSHDEPALQMLQRLRDEAHRFGITFHRELRSKQAVKSVLDEIPGIGPRTKKLLKSKIGTVDAIRKASLDDLTVLIGKQKAEMVKKYLG
jgi:excinuclease ABC subunit C